MILNVHLQNSEKDKNNWEKRTSQILMTDTCSRPSSDTVCCTILQLKASASKYIWNSITALVSSVSSALITGDTQNYSQLHIWERQIKAIFYSCPLYSVSTQTQDHIASGNAICHLIVVIFRPVLLKTGEEVICPLLAPVVNIHHGIKLFQLQ